MEQQQQQQQQLLLLLLQQQQQQPAAAAAAEQQKQHSSVIVICVPELASPWKKCTGILLSNGSFSGAPTKDESTSTAPHCGV